MAWTEKLPSDRWRGGYIDALGRKRQKGGFVHKTAAKTWAEDGEEAARKGEEFDPTAGRVTFKSWAERWQESRVVEPSTADRDKSRYAEVVERWGDSPIGAIGSLEIQGWVKEMTARGRAPGTVRKYHNMLSVILEAATLPPRLIAENPCRHVTLPTLPPGREVYLTEAQVTALVAELDKRGKQWGTLALFLANTGLRWGEATGLHVNRVDWLRRRVHVLNTMTQNGSVFALKAYPKGKQQRYVPLPDHVQERLSVHVTDFPPQPCGLHTDCPGLLFSAFPRWTKGNDARPISRQTFERHIFTPAAQLAKLPTDLVPHDLRHTYASWLVQAGVSLREVQQLLGQSSITTTERYSHLAPDAGEVARGVLDRKSNIDPERGKIRGNE